MLLLVASQNEISIINNKYKYNNIILRDQIHEEHDGRIYLILCIECITKSQINKIAIIKHRNNQFNNQDSLTRYSHKHYYSLTQTFLFLNLER